VDPSFAAWQLDGKINVYRLTGTKDATTKKRSTGTIALVHAGMAAHVMWTTNDDDPSGAGRIKRRSALTEDGVIVAQDADLLSQDWVKNVDPNDENFGTVHRVMGEVRRIRGVDEWAQVGFAKTMEDEHPPPGVV
jgi:hypothetical protein